MATITTKAQFRDYIKRQLGRDIINVELSNDQIDDTIDDSVQLVQRYLYGEGVYQDFLMLSISADVDEYNLSGTNIQDVIDMDLTAGLNNILVLHSNENFLLYNEYVVRGNYPGGPGSWNSQDTGMQLSTFHAQMWMLEEIRNRFGVDYYTEFRPHSGILKITPTPKTDGTALVQVYRREEAAKLYNFIHIKRLAVAKCMQIWGGVILGKTIMTLPGGGKFNGDAIYRRGKLLEDEVLEDIKSEGDPPEFFIG